MWGVTNTHANSNRHGFAHCNLHADRNGNSNGYSDSDCDIDANGYCAAKGYSDAETSADSPPAPVAGNVIGL